jgi:RNA polymerase sigma factor (TIGR02999 family)
LHTVAKSQRRRWSGDDTLDTTALVHEVYLRLSGASGLTLRDRAHFYAVAARATRQILSNYARRRRTQKRGTAAVAVSLDKVDILGIPRVEGGGSPLDRLWDLEIALQQLQDIHPRPCRVVECRYFGGLSIPDTAAALGISEATVKRDWMLAQAWLHRALKEHAPSHG